MYRASWRRRKILGLHRLVQAEQQHHPPEGVLDETPCDPEEGDHALMVSQRFSCGRGTVRDGIFAEHKSLFATQKPGDEQATLGEYYPVSTYQSKAGFEALGCPARKP